MFDEFIEAENTSVRMKFDESEAQSRIFNSILYAKWQLVHEGNKTFECKLCEKSFLTTVISIDMWAWKKEPIWMQTLWHEVCSKQWYK